MIYCVMGRTSSGKDTFARELSQKLNIPLVVSYTTRPIRDNEVNGREHYFVKEEEMSDYRWNVVTETKIGNYYYWVNKEQLCEDCVYVIDPKGLEILKSKIRNGNEIKVVYLKVDENIRRRRGMSRGDDMEVWEMRNKDEGEMFRIFEENTKMFGEWEKGLTDGGRGGIIKSKKEFFDYE